MSDRDTRIAGKRTAPGAKLTKTQRDYDPEFIVICTSAWMNKSGFGINYSWDGERFNNRDDAIRHGYAMRGSDDFNIGQTYGDNLVWFGWMDQRMDEPEETAREIAEAVGLDFNASWYRLEYSKSTGRVIARAALAASGGKQ